jgi:uncharacterized protein YkwD
MMMRRVTTLIAVFALVGSLAGCGTSDSDLGALEAAAATGGSSRPTNNAFIDPVPTPVPAPAGNPAEKPAGMTDREYAFAIDLLNKINTYRAGVPAPALTWNMAVAAVALQHNQSMQTANMLTHGSLPPNPPCALPPLACHGVRLTAGGVTWSRATENVARGQRTADEVLADWIASPLHKANLDDPLVSEIGIGYSEAGGPWWTMNCIAP